MKNNLSCGYNSMDRHILSTVPLSCSRNLQELSVSYLPLMFKPLGEALRLAMLELIVESK